MPAATQKQLCSVPGLLSGDPRERLRELTARNPDIVLDPVPERTIAVSFIAPGPRTPTRELDRRKAAGEHQLTEQARKIVAKALKEKNRKREQTRARRQKIQQEARCYRNGTVSAGTVPVAAVDAGAAQAATGSAAQACAAAAGAGAARDANAVSVADAGLGAGKRAGLGAGKRARAEHFQARRDMRARQKLDRKRVKLLKKTAQGLAHFNKADKHGKGTARSKRQDKVVRKLLNVERAKRRKLNPGDGLEPLSTAERARLCKWYITAPDRALVEASAKLPDGASQLLRTCTKGSACSHEHSDMVSSINKDLLIAKRARLLRAETGPERRKAARDRTYTGCLKYEKARGIGYIYPDTNSRSNKGGARKQRVFFHRSAWIGTTADVLNDQIPRGGLKVRYRREDNTSRNTRAVRWKAVGVSAIGTAPKTKSARVRSIAREVRAGTQPGITAGAAASAGAKTGTGAGAGAKSVGAASQQTAAKPTHVALPALPAGWEQQTDHAGRLYYIDHHNQESTWQRPGVGGPTAPSSAAKGRVNETPPAATGWEQTTDALGRTYYIDHDKQTTTWKRPAAVGQPGGERDHKTPKTSVQVMQEAGDKRGALQATRKAPRKARKLQDTRKHQQQRKQQRARGGGKAR